MGHQSDIREPVYRLLGCSRMSLRSIQATTLRMQLRLEEGHYGRIEFAVEGGAIESCGVAAGLGSNRFERRRARCHERKVTGVRHHAVFGFTGSPSYTFWA